MSGIDRPDARLIVMAPELLAVVRTISEWGIIIGPETKDYIDTVKKARALIETLEPSQSANAVDPVGGIVEG